MKAPGAVTPSDHGKASRRAELADLGRVFLRLGATAFGGPAAHVALIEDEFVRRRQWLTRTELLDLVSATQLIPGPNSTELALLIGQRRAGLPGLLVAGAGFILPSALMVAALAAAYVHFGKLPAMHGIMTGIQPVIIAIILQALWGFARTAIQTRPLAALGAGAAALGACGVAEPAVLAGCGLLVAFARRGKAPTSQPTPRATVVPLLPTALATATPVAAASAAVAGLAAFPPVTLTTLFALFLKTGAILFGSGYVLLAFLRRDFVENRPWLTETQLLDAIAVGQFTPGPVFTTATFIGYLLAGPAGATVSTLGIFLPAFLLVAVSGRLIPRLRNSPTAAAFLDGLNVGSVALMAVVAFHLTRVAWTDLPSLATTAVGLFLLVRFRVNSAWLVLAGAGLGLLRSLPT